MRSEEQIRHALAQLNEFLKLADPETDGDSLVKRASQKTALEWVLSDEPISPVYYCMGCHLPHKGLKCPQCGNEVAYPVPKPE